MLNEKLLTIAICTYCRNECLLSTLNSIASGRCGNYSQVIIVDQNYDDNLKKLVLSEKYRNIVYIKMQKPHLTKARNIALRKCMSDYICYLDDDTEVGELVFNYHLEPYVDSRVGAVTGEKIQEDKNIQWHEDSLLSKGMLPVTWGPGFNMSFRVDALRSIGGFDENIMSGALNDDVDVGERIRSKGWLYIYYSQAKVKHLLAPYGGSRKDKGNLVYAYRYLRDVSYFNVKRGSSAKRVTIEISKSIIKMKNRYTGYYALQLYIVMSSAIIIGCIHGFCVRYFSK